MSHASVLVAVKADVADVESAVAHQMEPFEEGGWFEDGSRWDWYQIGGRFMGTLSGYDPQEDPKNVEECGVCHGTGTRPGGLKEFGAEWMEQMNGCNGCQGKGKRVVWPTSFTPHGGDILILKDLVPNRLIALQEKRARDCYAEAMKDERDSSTLRELIYGVKPGESQADFVKRRTAGGWFPSFYAFLHNRHWHENERMGWFGSPAKSECAIKGREKGRCLFVHEDTQSRIVGWNDPEGTWGMKFYDRFIKPLEPETVLVVVDYHV